MKSNLLFRLLLVFGIILISSLVSAQWVSKANALKLRSELGETIVYNSKIYAFTGFSDGNYYCEPSTEVYDPSANTWSYLASMPPNTAMTHADAILVDNTVWHIGGRVGKNPGPMSSAVWIYNITTNSWSRGPEIRNPATGDTMVIAASASVLLGRTIHVFGGFTPTACNNDQDQYHLTLDVDSWLSNPTQPAQWKNDLKPLPLKRNHLSAAVLGGKIYAIGGQMGHDCGGGQDVAYCHVYNPATDTWTRLPDLPTARSHAEGSTFSIDGKIYIVGGQGSDGNSTKYVTSFDPSANNGVGAWTENTSLQLPSIYEGMSATIIGNSFIISHGSIGASVNPKRLTYSRTITRNPVYKLGFPSECINLFDSSANALKSKTLLFTIDGSKQYTTSSNAAWLSVTKNASGTAVSNAVDIQVTANPAGLSSGVYHGTITATGVSGGTYYTPATLCVTLTVQQNGDVPQYNLNVSSEGSGTINKNPDQATYGAGTEVTLTAVPATGQQFTGWSGDASGSTNPLVITMDADKSVTATFDIAPQYNLTVSSNGDGTINKNPDQSDYTSGTNVTLTAVPATGQQFTGWSGDASGNVNPLTVTMDGDKNIIANFSLAPTFAITNITTTSTRKYALSKLILGDSVYTDRSFTAASAPSNLINASLIKTPNDDKTNNSSNILSFNINDYATIYVSRDPSETSLPSWMNGFTKLSTTLGVLHSNVSNMKLYSKVFSPGKITLGGNMQSPAAGATNNYLIIIVPTTPPAQYSLTTSVNGSGSISKNPDQASYNSGSSVTLIATPASGQQFTGWSGDASGTTNPLTINMNVDKSITANFAAATSVIVSNITTTTGRSYILSNLVTGVQVYTDRTYTASSVPSIMNNAPFIKTPNDDKSNNSSALFSFNVSQDATIYIAYDPRKNTLPSWMSGFQKLTSRVGVNDSKISYMELYSKNYTAGKITLGGNLQSPASGAQNNYFVIILPQGQILARPSNSIASSVNNDKSKGNLNLKIYPNPAPGNNIIIEANNFAKRENITIIVQDQLGKTIRIEQVTANENGSVIKQIALSNFQIKGVYIIKAIAASGIYQKKLVIE